jgi:hypothetical protein
MSDKHDCVSRINEQLKVHNTKIGWAYSLSTPPQELIPILTIKAEDSVRKKPMALYASFCPFCGVSLRPKPIDQEGGAA